MSLAMSVSASASASASTSAATSASTAAFAGNSGGPVPPARIDLAAAPRGTFDPTDEKLRAAATTFERALTASTVEEEEALWTVVIESCERAGNAEWVPDIASRALGNRGNARSRQGRLVEALGDYNAAIAYAPYAVDPVLNRGVALESLGRFQEAAADYSAVLAVAPNDPAAWNNLGNAQVGDGVVWWAWWVGRNAQVSRTCMVEDWQWRPTFETPQKDWQWRRMTLLLGTTWTTHRWEIMGSTGSGVNRSTRSTGHMRGSARSGAQ
ncbi:unnamed protein product [Closterium sp. NIES-54]